MARKRKRRAAAVTTSSKLAAKQEAMAVTSLSLSALPVLPTSKKNNSNQNASTEKATTTEVEAGKEKMDLKTSSAKKLIENSEPLKMQSQPLITAASCRRKQAKPQRKNGESYSIHTNTK